MVSDACGHFLVVKSRVFYNQISEIRTVDPNWEFYNNNIRLDLFWRRRTHFFVDKHCIYNNVTRFVVSQTNSGFNYYNEKKRSPGSGNVRYRMSENFGFASANFDELSNKLKISSTKRARTSLKPWKMSSSQKIGSSEVLWRPWDQNKSRLGGGSKNFP